MSNKIKKTWVPLASSWRDNMDGTMSKPYCKLGAKAACSSKDQRKLFKCMLCEHVFMHHRDMDLALFKTKGKPENRHEKESKRSLLHKLFK